MKAFLINLQKLINQKKGKRVEWVERKRVRHALNINEEKDEIYCYHS